VIGYYGSTARGLPGADAPPDDFRVRVRAHAADLVAAVPAAERERRFPRAAVERLGGAGLLRERWAAPDARLGAIFAEELGRAGTGGIGLGLTVHLEAALSIVLRHGATPLLRRVGDEALAGSSLLAVAASEAGGGSDLASVGTTARRDGDSLCIRGTKRYVSLGASADHLIVTCRPEPPARGGLMLVLVPRDQVRIEKRLATAGVRSIETARVSIDARVPTAATIAEGRAGMLALSWGLTHERLATAALVVGTASLAVGLAVAHLARRHVGGAPLLERQALRLRVAEHAAHIDALSRAVHSLAAAGLGDSRTTREVAGLKATAARVGERAVSDCMHFFGGRGYVEDESPLARLWRDVRAARIGAGTDEMMWELVAGGLVPADAAYDALVEPEE